MPKEIKVRLKLDDKLSKATSKAEGKIARFGKRVNSVFKKLVNLRNAVVVGGIVLVGKAFVNAASKIEVFAKQLEIVSESGAKASKALAAIREFARTSPLETEDVVKSFVRLKAVGIDPTLKQMRTIGGVAVLMNREMTEVLDAFIGLNKRTLRQLGIDIDRTGKTAIIKSGNVRKEVNKDTASIRAALLELWEERFPNAIERAADTTISKTAIMKSNIFEMSVTLGDKLKPAWDRVLKVVGDVANQIDEMLKIESVTDMKSRIEVLDKNILKTQTAINELRHKELVKSLPTQKVQATLTKDLNKLLAEKAELLGKIRVETGFAATRTEGLLKAFKGEGGAEKFKLDADPLDASGALGTGAEDLNKTLDKQKDKFTELTEHIWLSQSAYHELKNEQALVQEALKETEIQIGKTNKALNDATESKFDLDTKRSAARAKELDEEKKIAKEKKKIRDKDIDTIVDANIALGRTINGIVADQIASSDKAAGRKKTQLKALALVDASAAAIIAMRTALDSGIPAPGNFFLGLALMGQVIAATSKQISNINNAKFAGGTDFAPGGSAIVGEFGAERINLPRGSQVLTNQQTNNSSVNMTVNISGNPSDSQIEKVGNVLQDFANNFSDAKRLGFLDLTREGVVTV